MENFKSIQMSKLKVGDIFAHEIKILNREAFKVLEIKEKTMLVKSRNTDKEINKQIKGKVFFLRHE